jgi:hypothetical protein
MCRVDLLGWMFGAAILAALAGGACTEPNAKLADVSPSSASSNSRPSGSTAELAMSEPGPYTLGHEPLSVTLRLPEDRRERLAAVAAGKQPGTLRLVVEGIEMLHPGAVYDVHLEPAAGRTPSSSEPSFLGHIAIYGKPGETPESSRGFDVTERARALWSRGPAGPIQILFVPSDRDEARAPEASLRFRRVALVERPPAGS